MERGRKVKKLTSFILAVALILGIAAVPVSAAGTKVYVTIANENGELVLSRAEVEVTDIDNDGALTINDALYIAHENNFQGGAAAGYASATGQWGLSLTKLWGVENGGSYGYYVNNASAMGLTDPVTEGAHVYAFIYTDLTAWSDAYSFFDKETVTGKVGDQVKLALKKATFDASYQQVNVPVEGAVIYVNGQATQTVTDVNGEATVTLSNEGTVTISAKSETATLVPPVCVATVTAAEAPQMGESTTPFVIVGIAMLAAVFVLASRKNEKENEI